MSELAERLAPESALAADDFSDLRQAAQRALMQHGFPDLKTEAWKYTPIRLLEKREFQTGAASSAEAPELPFDACLLHFDNGILNADTAELPAGVKLEAATRDDFEGIEYGGREDAFAWLNLARFGQAWKIRIEGELDKPLVLATTTADDFAAAVHPRLFIELADNARATLVEWQAGGGEGMVNAVNEIRVGQGAALNHVMRRSGGDIVRVSRTRVDVVRDAEYRSFVLDTGARLGRQDLNVYLKEAGAHGEIDGTVVLDSKQHVDYHTSIDHCTGHTNSREAFRLLADGTGVGVFNGRIHIHEDSDDSHSDLNTASLLLGEMARINAKPELEIYSEDVTASHGATIGQLDDDALFYLRSRGLPTEKANTLLKYGFAAEPLEGQAEAPVRDWLLAELQGQL
ncbi:SufB/SufD family protein [Wenzhouxiangella sediminis]|uniref:SufD family Fe-S cluster assembly protein n=1 Tax=Wenzhouxiangella sediminis TaxID=1792836 RepID=A0A3E1KAK1_9GAMM|nr:SufD family Fe-S cluster assembly protein [Wenzhouxiangella sediminis]RFF31218.1 SufD family Fe-S cluster assembly protein [Wenzhouxiangella sediminis]